MDAQPRCTDYQPEPFEPLLVAADHLHGEKLCGLSTYVYLRYIYTFTHYSGPDPQLVSAVGRDISGGYPNAHNYTVGLSVQF